MVFDVKRLRGNPDRSEACAPPEAPTDDLTARLEASVAAVAINRPTTLAEYRALPENLTPEQAADLLTVQAQADGEYDVLDVTTIEGPGAGLVETTFGPAVVLAARATLAERHAALVASLEVLLADARALADELGGGS